MVSVNINERSWAIDLISEINSYVHSRDLIIKSAGGENTLKNSSGNLFPDVLLFGDIDKGEIIQGWELKMPDTPITDSEFFDNARKKAELLNLDSFLLWNVSTAVLYKRESSNTFQPVKHWQPINNIKTRADVQKFKSEWKKLLSEILTDLNDYFVRGTLSKRILIENLSLKEFVELILENTDQTAHSILAASQKNRRLGAEINLWWNASKVEYNDVDGEYNVLARLVLTDWLIKFLFANIIKRNFNAAKKVEELDFESSIDDGIALFEGISKKSDFWNIFSSNLAQSHITLRAWDQLLQINQFLREINLQSIGVDILHEILQNSIFISRRKIAGQYSTPKRLAELLVGITIDDISGNVLDPCCGTGTIIREAFLLKAKNKIPLEKICKSIWASDKYSFPLQLATINLSNPQNYGQILHVFRKDVVELGDGNPISFTDPNNGNEIQEPLPLFKSIVSNLPFVQQEDLKSLNPNIGKINSWISKQLNDAPLIAGRSDLYVYIPFYLWNILEPNGKLGLILSNAWLATDYGKTFISLIRRFYEIESITISGKGKWFSNADVVTTLLVLKKLKLNKQSTGKTRFCTIKKKIDEVDEISDLSDRILVGKSNSDVKIIEYDASEIVELETLGMPWSSYFAGITFLTELTKVTVQINTVFEIGRGERRGWNKMFYPEEKHSIEKKFIKPVLKNLKGCKGLIAVPNKEAFCCSEKLSELKKKGYKGAISWISKFEHENNEKGIPLTKSLIRSNHYWYEMKSDTLADFVANINYDKSLFIAKLSQRSFVDQRMIALITKPLYKKVESSLLLALLNSSLSMLMIESLGFGRGLGALDLNSTKFEDGFRILDPSRLSKSSITKIIKTFEPLLKRDRLPLYKELESKDRKVFETTLYEEFGLLSYQNKIIDALLTLYNIRNAVHD